MNNGKEKKHRRLKIIALAFVGIIILCVVGMLLIPDSTVDNFIKNQIVTATNNAYPGSSLNIGDLHYKRAQNILSATSVSFSSGDSSIVFTASSLSLGGISRWQLLKDKKFTARTLTNAWVDAEDLVLGVPKEKNQFQCKQIHVSVPDSEIIATGATWKATANDEEYFSVSNFRRTKSNITVPQLKIEGADCFGLLQGTLYHARSLETSDATFDIVSNKDRPAEPVVEEKSTITLLPNEILSSIKQRIEIGALNITNAHLRYAARLAGASKDELTVQNIHLVAKGISNNPERGTLTLSDIYGDAHDVVAHLPEYELICKQLHLSSADSLISAEGADLHTAMSDEKFFSLSKFRRTRLDIAVPHIRAEGADCLGLLAGTQYRARSLAMSDGSLDIVINKDKPPLPVIARKNPVALLPNEVLSSIKERIEIGSLNITNVRLRYAARLVGAAKENEFTVGNVQLVANGISNNRERGAFTVSDAYGNARDIAAHFPGSQYELLCKQLHLSTRDSLITAEGVDLRTTVSDEKFFAASKFRNPRYHLTVGRAKVTGSDCIGLIIGSKYTARSVEIDEPALDFLLNKDKPYDESLPSPSMPGELFTSMKEIMQIDVVNITNARLKYGERMLPEGQPGIVSFNAMQIHAEGITNHRPGAAIQIHAEGNFMKKSAMKINMTIPIAPPPLAFHYSGSLSAWDATELNSFLEYAEFTHIKSGNLTGATFDITVVKEHASGWVRMEYQDLTILFVNKKTGSTKAPKELATSYLAKILAIREGNPEDSGDPLKIGDVNYTRGHDNTFIEVAWFSLRSGIGNVVGF